MKTIALIIMLTVTGCAQAPIQDCRDYMFTQEELEMSERIKQYTREEIEKARKREAQ